MRLQRATRPILAILRLRVLTLDIHLRVPILRRPILRLIQGRLLGTRLRLQAILLLDILPLEAHIPHLPRAILHKAILPKQPLAILLLRAILLPRAILLKQPLAIHLHRAILLRKDTRHSRDIRRSPILASPTLDNYLQAGSFQTLFS